MLHLLLLLIVRSLNAPLTFTNIHRRVCVRHALFTAYQQRRNDEQYPLMNCDKFDCCKMHFVLIHDKSLSFHFLWILLNDWILSSHALLIDCKCYLFKFKAIINRKALFSSTSMHWFLFRTDIILFVIFTLHSLNTSYVTFCRYVNNVDSALHSFNSTQLLSNMCVCL